MYLSDPNEPKGCLDFISKHQHKIDLALKLHHVPSFPSSIATHHPVQPQLQPHQAASKPLRNPESSQHHQEHHHQAKVYASWLSKKPHRVTDRVLDGLMFYAWRIARRGLALEALWVVALTRAACKRRLPSIVVGICHSCGCASLVRSSQRDKLCETEA
jgi:hypothetical protein